MKSQTTAAIDLLGRGITPVFGETTCKPSDPTPTYDKLRADWYVQDLGKRKVLDLLRRAVGR